MLSFLCNNVSNFLAVSEWKLSIRQIFSQCSLFHLFLLTDSASQHDRCLHYEFHQYCIDILLISRIIIDWSTSLITGEKCVARQTRKYEAIKSNHNCFLHCRVLLQNHFLSSPNNTDAYLFLNECAACTQADGCELLGDVKWILY